MPQSLRDQVVRLAYVRGDLRPHLLRLLHARGALPDEVLKVIHDYRGTVAKDVVPRVFERFREYHPLAGQCRHISCGLASAINAALGEDRARVVGGWFRKSGQDYYFPSDGAGSSLPEGVRQPGESWKEHWWVELDGHYIDVSADQFFPSDVKEQEAHQVVVEPKSKGSYYPHRRRPLGVPSVKPLPANLEALAAKIVSMKQSRQWSFTRSDKYGVWKFETWLRANASKYSLSGQEVADFLATMQHEKVEADMMDIDAVRGLLREVV